MKKRTLLLFYGILLVSVLVWSASTNGRADQAGQGHTGAPCETSTQPYCGSCHSGVNYGGPNGEILESLTVTDLSTNMPTNEYIPGQTYQVDIVIAPFMDTPAGYGFQACVIDGSGAEAGTWQNISSNVKAITLTNFGSCGIDRVYVEHNGVSPTGTFTMEWVAPSTDIGDVTFHYVGNCVNGSSLSGDNGSISGKNFTLMPSSPACNSNLQVDNTIAAGTYAAEDVVSSKGTVPTGTTVDFRAQDCINLESDFEVQAGGEFSAEIDPTACN